MGEHDQLFKRAFRIPEHAAGELRAVLPPELCQAIDFSSLSLVSSESIDQKLDVRFSDALFCANLRGVTGYIWLLLEHQSEPDHFMALRALEYAVRTWSDLLRLERDRKTLPPVICVVVHHGEGGWTAPTRLYDLIEGLNEVPELRPLVPSFEILVDDLVGQPDAELQRRPLPVFPQLVLWALRDARTIRRFYEHLRAWSLHLESLAQQAPEDFGTLMRYIWTVAGEVSVTDIKNKILEVAPRTEQAMASPAEQLIQQGVKRGEAIGRAEGKAEGKAEGVVLILEARGVVLTPEQRAEILACKDLTRLDRWLRDAVSIGNAGDLFGH